MKTSNDKPQNLNMYYFIRLYLTGIDRLILFDLVVLLIYGKTLNCKGKQASDTWLLFSYMSYRPLVY